MRRIDFTIIGCLSLLAGIIGGGYIINFTERVSTVGLEAAFLHEVTGFLAAMGLGAFVFVMIWIYHSFEEQNELRDSLELGTRPPSSRMIWRALKIAREQNVLLTPEILESFERTRGFLIAYSRDDGPSR
ncbi:hypothetical protein [Burkholderia anthina]|uniref:hypothetical protein n=1 Tax=Burkholderia anthina TaxID=179879 RepID=UPI0037BF8A46